MISVKICFTGASDLPPPEALYALRQGGRIVPGTKNGAALEDRSAVSERQKPLYLLRTQRTIMAVLGTTPPVDSTGLFEVVAVDHDI